MVNVHIMTQLVHARLVRPVVIGLVLPVILLVVGAVWYDISSFEPRRNEITKLLASANPDESHPPAQLRRVIVVAHKNYDISNYVARQLLFYFDDVKNDGIGWNLRFAMWVRLIRFHYDNEEIVGLYAVLADRDHIKGLSNLSQKYFSKPIPQLTEDECALLVASLQIPFSETERLRARANEILKDLAKSKRMTDGRDS